MNDQSECAAQTTVYLIRSIRYEMFDTKSSALGVKYSGKRAGSSAQIKRVRSVSYNTTYDFRFMKNSSEAKQ
ncbi:MAG: hypothetical protein CL599_11215 [Alteromonas sp.]|nr:hypothetical protein [Alteromonas sp.]OUX86547.1 MAG: hypothetical protein CBB95_10970 [Alteromonas sp. TMED35]